MKKTLTILLSLVGVTVAEANIVQELFTLTDAAETKALYIPGEEADTVDNSWTFVLTLNPSELAELTGTSLKNLFNLSFEDSGSTSVGYYPSGPAQFVVSGASHLTDGLPPDFSWENVTGAALTFVTSPTGSNVGVSIYEYIVLADGEPLANWYTGKNLVIRYPETLGSVSITSEVGVQSVTCYYGSATEKEAAALAMQAATGVVPEPTTATLSLLALAGLAVRRRRK